MSEKTQKYDPNVKYGWNNDTEFVLKGNEFGLILNTFRTILTSEEAQKILLMNRANDVMESLLQRNVESGNVKPASIPEDVPQNKAPMGVVKESEEDKN